MTTTTANRLTRREKTTHAALMAVGALIVAVALLLAFNPPANAQNPYWVCRKGTASAGTSSYGVAYGYILRGYTCTGGSHFTG